jgi:cell division transport system ATP-binding protein
MLTFKNVYKEYKGKTVLDNINFHIDEGEFVFLVGHSGAGKSTVIRLVIKEENLTSGSIHFAGYDIEKLNKKALPYLRREIGVVFQDFKLLPRKTTFENVSFALELSDHTNREIKKSVDYILDMVGLSTKSKMFPHQLSGGERQRVAIARALVNNPHILIADEPTGNLDPLVGWDIIQLLNKINSWGTTVLMATHASDIVNSMQKRVIALDEGRIIRDSEGGYNE